MTPEQITQWAREAGCPPLLLEFSEPSSIQYPVADSLAAFAALVAAHEREMCAKVCEETWVEPG